METTALKPLRIHLQEFLESVGADYQCDEDKQRHEHKSLHSVQRRKRLDEMPHAYAGQSSGREKNRRHTSSEQDEQ